MAPQGGSRAWEALTPALSEWILEAVSSMGFLRMTPVQASTIPLFIGNKDVVVEAVTGSGKTLSFLIPVVERLLKLEEPIKKHHVGAIIISPTRELATQIHSVLLALLAFHPASAAHLDSTRTSEHSNQTEIDASAFSSSTLKVVPQLLLGGTTTPAQDLASFLTHSPNLLISTPGRLLELLSSPHVHCPQSSFEVLVMDEADRLLDLGFKEDLQKILQRLPKQRRTGLFSASVSEAVDQLVRVGLRNPVRISVKVRGASGVEEERKTPASLQMTYLTTPATHKLPTLIRLLTTLTPQPLKSIAYLSTCAAVDYFQHLLPTLIPHLTSSSSNQSHQKLTIIPLHGKHTPAIRTKNFTRFTTATTPTLLLTTDLAARGLDIPQVDLTVQLDPPSDPKTFLHRAGRAGRAGRKGLSVVFLAEGREAEEYPRFLAVRKTPVEPLTGADVAVSDAEATTCTDAMRRVVKADRGLHDKGQRAFVSWVRSYSKHAAKGIFRVEELPWGDLVDSWALLRVPRMPELKRASDGKGWDVLKRELEGRLGDAGMTVDWESYKYKDVEREKKRRREMVEAANGDGSQRSVYASKGKQASNSWAATLAAKKEKEERREKKKRKRTAEHDSKMTVAEKKEQQEVKDMVEEMRRRVASGKEEEFHGFD